MYTRGSRVHTGKGSGSLNLTTTTQGWTAIGLSSRRSSSVLRDSLVQLGVRGVAGIVKGYHRVCWASGTGVAVRVEPLD